MSYYKAHICQGDVNYKKLPRSLCVVAYLTTRIIFWEIQWRRRLDETPYNVTRILPLA